MFEQSGTFKHEFIKLGYLAEDYDIQNDFNETDHVIDLFTEIENGYANRNSCFDYINADSDLILAFFPCIEFSFQSQLWYSLNEHCYNKWSYQQRIEYMIGKNKNRAKLYELFMKLVSICLSKGFRLIIENPYASGSYLRNNVILKQPSLIDNDRTRRGDFFKKPTAYWFWNCEPTFGNSFQYTKRDRIQRVIDAKRSSKAGMCSAERSAISSDYARNFICDFILGKKQEFSQPLLFD